MKLFCNFVLVVQKGECARAAGRVKCSQESTQEEGKMPIKSRDLAVHKNDVKTET